MNKFIRILIIINGLIIPIVLLVLLFFIIKDVFRSSGSYYKPESVNTENTITKEGDTLIRQGLRYNEPEAIYNSRNYMLKVMPKTYEEPRKFLSSSRRTMNFESAMSMPDEYFVNIVFLDKSFNVIGKLIDKKASIHTIMLPPVFNNEKNDTTVKNIGYLIGFEDTNHDKKIDWQDNYDLYISDLNGQDLVQVTKGIDINEFRFINANKELFISYSDRSSIKDEYKIIQFAIYNIGSRQLRRLTDIDKELNSVQKILN